MAKDMDDAHFADTVRFAHETIDGETVVLDAARGHLFLFTGLGPWLWHRMQRGGTIEGVVGEVSARFGDKAAEPTREFLGSLIQAEILRTDRPAGALSVAELPYPDSFVPPTVEKFDDIADIITMDPIHDVDAAGGWPRRMDPGKGGK